MIRKISSGVGETVGCCAETAEMIKPTETRARRTERIVKGIFVERCSRIYSEVNTCEILIE